MQLEMFPIMPQDNRQHRRVLIAMKETIQVLWAHLRTI